MKKISVLIIIFLLTGCRVKYDLVINDDLTIIEEAKLTGTDEFFSNYYKTTKTNVLKSIVDVYHDVLEENNYQYELKEEQTPYVLVTKKYDSVNEYINNSKLFNNYFDKINYSENGNIKKIETEGFNPNEPENPDRFNVKELEIAIKCPYQVTNHNAIRINKATNTFYYELNDKNNKIIFEYDTSIKYNPNEDITLVIIMGIVAIICTWGIVLYLDKKAVKNKK